MANVAVPTFTIKSLPTGGVLFDAPGGTEITSVPYVLPGEFVYFSQVCIVVLNPCGHVVDKC